MTRAIDSRATLERQGAGRYEVRLKAGGSEQRIGMLLGCSGSWHAETPDGCEVSCFNTRADAVAALINAADLRTLRRERPARP